MQKNETTKSDVTQKRERGSNCMKLTATKLATAALAAVAMLGASQARADFIFTIDTGNAALSGFAGPYAQVDVNLTSSTTATITFTSLLNSGNIYLLGDGGSVAVNVNGAFTLGTITGSNAGTGFTPGPWSNGGSGNEDGLGTYNLTINSFDGYTHSSDTISFTITKSSGTWSSATDVLAGDAGSLGNIAAAHIFVAASPANGGANGGAALVTGFAAGNGTVPEPTTVLAGALLLLPFGASTLRILRRNRAA
jgi:hypothetical protein